MCVVLSSMTFFVVFKDKNHLFCKRNLLYAAKGNLAIWPRQHEIKICPVKKHVMAGQWVNFQRRIAGWFQCLEL